MSKKPWKKFPWRWRNKLFLKKLLNSVAPLPGKESGHLQCVLLVLLLRRPLLSHRPPPLQDGLKHVSTATDLVLEDICTAIPRRRIPHVATVCNPARMARNARETFLRQPGSARRVAWDLNLSILVSPPAQPHFLPSFALASPVVGRTRGGENDAAEEQPKNNAFSDRGLVGASFQSLNTQKITVRVFSPSSFFPRKKR